MPLHPFDVVDVSFGEVIFGANLLILALLDVLVVVDVRFP